MHTVLLYKVCTPPKIDTNFNVWQNEVKTSKIISILCSPYHRHKIILFPSLNPGSLRGDVRKFLAWLSSQFEGILASLVQQEHVKLFMTELLLFLIDACKFFLWKSLWTRFERSLIELNWKGLYMSYGML